MSENVIIALIALIAGFAGSLPSLYISLKKGPADAEQAQASAQKIEDEITERVLTRAHSEMASMQLQINELRTENRQLRAWAQLLCAQIVGMGKDPVPMPNHDGSCN